MKTIYKGKYSEIKVVDRRAYNGAHSEYYINAINKEGRLPRATGYLFFQDRPIEKGVNGIRDIDVLLVLIDRFKAIVDGPQGDVEYRQIIIELELVSRRILEFEEGEKKGSSSEGK